MLSENQRFERIYDATAKAFGLNSAQMTVSKGSKKRWRDLADIWETHRMSELDDIFYAAVHKVHWGLIPESVDSTDKEALVELIEEELIRNGDAFHAWKRHLSYKVGILNVVNLEERAQIKRGPSYHSRAMEKYLRCRTIDEIVYKKERVECNFVTATEFEIRSYITRMRRQDYYKGFETVIRELIPVAQTWNKKQWSDDKNICEEIKRTFGTDYIRKGNELTALIELLIHMWVHEERRGTLAYVLRLRELPLSIVQYIWPCDTVDVVAKMFTTAYSRTKAVEARRNNAKQSRGLSSVLGISVQTRRFSYNNLKNSWLFKQVRTWVYDGTITAESHPKAKKAVLELEMMQPTA